MARIFISHSSVDNHAATAFRDWLVAHGWPADDVFLDLHGIGAGARWKDALRTANERAEAVVLLASPESLASTECRLEIRMAEDLGKEILVAILRDLTIEAPALAEYRERQIVDLSAEPRVVSLTASVAGDLRAVHFNGDALERIKARLEELGLSPNRFAWDPGPDLDTASPFPGLGGFSEADAGVFFGRGGDIAHGLADIRKLRRVTRHNGAGGVLAIQAASGAGKSSFLKAGLWPRLRRDPDFTVIGVLRPAGGVLTGEHGLGRVLADWFAERGESVSAADVHSALRDRGAEALAELLDRATVLAHAGRQVADVDAVAPAPVLAVDQAEELFAADDAEESRVFLGLLKEICDPTAPAALQLLAPPIVMATIRADSVDALLHAASEIGMAPPRLLPLPPIPRELYIELVARPTEVARSHGVDIRIDDALIQALVRDASGADAMPLLAFTLKLLLAEFREGRRAVLTLQQYEAMGGVAGALSRRLQAARRSLKGAVDFDAALKALFLPRLATWDADATPPGAKRLIALEASVLDGERATLRSLVDALVEERLLSRGKGAEGPTLEVAHEALLRQPPIADWLEEDREFLSWREHAARAAGDWAAERRELMSGRELAVAEGWAVDRAEDLPEEVRSFVEKSRTAEAAREKGSRRRRRNLVLSLGVGLAAAIVAGVFGYQVWTDQQKRSAEARRTDIIGQLVASSAESGTEASDGAEDASHSPYVEALLPQLRDRGIGLSDALLAVNNAMRDLQDFSQRPFFSTSLNGEIYLWDQPASREKLALVVSVSRIDGMDRLRNAENDASFVADLLGEAGFEVIRLIDPTRRQLLSSVRELGQRPCDGAAQIAGVPVVLAGFAKIQDFTGCENRLTFGFFTGFGFSTDEGSFVAASDTRSSLQPEDAPFEAINVDDLKRHLDDTAAASVVIFDTGSPRLTANAR